MDKPRMMKQDVFDALSRILDKNIGNSLYESVWKNEKSFLKMGVTLEDISDLLEMKEMAQDYPNPEFYQVYDQSRATYIYENLSNPEIKLYGDNERSFLAAARLSDSYRIDFEQKADSLSKTVSKAFGKMWKQQEVLEQEGWNSWKGVRYQASKAIDKINILLRGYNRKEAPEGVERFVEPITMLEPGKMVSRDVMVDNHRLWCLTDEQKIASDNVTVLYRIQANKDINYVFGVDVVKGELGGWIESENNLEGNAWVGDNAEVFGRAKVINSAVVDNAIVKDDAKVINDSCIAGNSQITGSSTVDNSIVVDEARIGDFAAVTNAYVEGYSSILGVSHIYDCSCTANTHIKDSKIYNVDMSGDIYIDSSEYGYGEASKDRDYVDYVNPSLISTDLLMKLRAHQEDGLKGEVVCCDDGREFIADLDLVKGKYLTMDLAVSNPVIRCYGNSYDGQNVLDKLKELHYPIKDLQPEILMNMLAGEAQLLGEHSCTIRQVGEEFVMETNFLEGTENEQKEVTADERLNMDSKSENVVERYPANVKMKNLFVFTGDEKIASDGMTVLYRIQANRDLSFINEKDVPEGTLGGWIESEENLSGYSWVGDNAEVFGRSKVDNSVILGNSIVRDEAVVKESTVWGNSLIKDDAEVLKSLVSGHARIGDTSVLDDSVFMGYGSICGKSNLQHCFCRHNVNITDSLLRNVKMEGDFMVRDEDLNCLTNEGGLNSFGYTPPALIVDSLLERLRACPEGVKGLTLCATGEKEFIADLKLVEGEDMRMLVSVSNPLIRCKGVSYDSHKVTDGLNKLNRDITGIHPDRLAKMMDGEPLHVRSVWYVVQQKGEEYELADLRKRVKNIEIYSLKEGGMAIRCTIDGEQQMSKKLSAETLLAFNDKTDRRALAVDYFMDELREHGEVEHSMRR